MGLKKLDAEGKIGTVRSLEWLSNPLRRRGECACRSGSTMPKSKGDEKLYIGCEG